MQLGTLSLSPYGSLCAHTVFPRREEVEGKEKSVCVCKRKFVCAAAALSKMPTLLHNSPYLFMNSLLSRVTVWGDHLQSHLHNDNNKEAPIGCVCVCVCVCVCMGASVRVRSRMHDFTCSLRSCVHLHLLSFPCLDRSPSLNPPHSSPNCTPPCSCTHTRLGMTLGAHRSLPGCSPL